LQFINIDESCCKSSGGITISENSLSSVAAARQSRLRKNNRRRFGSIPNSFRMPQGEFGILLCPFTTSSCSGPQPLHMSLCSLKVGMAQLSKVLSIFSPSLTTRRRSVQLLHRRAGRGPCPYWMKGSSAFSGLVSAFGMRWEFTNFPCLPVSLQIPLVLAFFISMLTRREQWSELVRFR
jgi:hypothetical protein